MGIHLTLTSEWESYRWRSLTGDPRLADDDGFLPRDLGGLFAMADVDAVRAECRAQVLQAIAWGVDVTHVDSHMGANQLHADYFDVYLDVADEFDLPLRMGPVLFEESQGFLQRHAAAARGVWFCDDLVLASGDGDTWRGLLAARHPGVTECFVHAALDTSELRAVASDAGQRVTDHWLATSPESPFADVELVTYAEIRDAQRAARAQVLPPQP